MAHRLSRTARARAFRNVGKYHSSHKGTSHKGTSHKGTMDMATLRPFATPRVAPPLRCPEGTKWSAKANQCVATPRQPGVVAVRGSDECGCPTPPHG